MVSVLEQTLADIGEEVKMAGQDRNGFLQGSDKLAGGLGHGTDRKSTRLNSSH